MSKKQLGIIIICVALSVFLTVILTYKSLGKSVLDIFSKDRKENAKEISQSLLADNENSPESNKVEVVRRVALPEAVTVGSGDIGAFYENEEFEDVVPVDIDSFSESVLPRRYDSRNVDGRSYVTGVRDQGYSSLCWAFAAIGAVESDLLRHHEEIDPGELDLSEKHLSYYNVHRTDGSKEGLIDEDYRELTNFNNLKNDWIFDYDTGYVVCGGVSDYSINLLTSWKGPVDDKGNDSFKKLYGGSDLFTLNSDVPSGPYEGSYHVQEVCQVPGNMMNTVLIKQMVMEHGGASVGVCTTQKFWKDKKKALYSEFYDEPVKTADHETLIIGWDDDYPASNFSITPKGNGAWLCKNSWGNLSGDGGYFYLSYYDDTAAISSVSAYHVAMEGDEDWYDNNYQAAAFSTNVASTNDDTENFVNVLSMSANPYGMLYKAGGDELLKAVGILGLDMYQQYTIEIILNPEHSAGEIDLEDEKEPVLTQKVSAISAGYHSFELKKTIRLSEGDEFLILIKPTSRGRLIFESQAKETHEANYDSWMNFTGNVHNNYVASWCSYYISDDGTKLKMQKDKDFFVKAYTVNR